VIVIATTVSNVLQHTVVESLPGHG